MLIHLNKLLLATAKATVNVGPDMPLYTYQSEIHAQVQPLAVSSHEIMSTVLQFW